MKYRGRNSSGRSPSTYFGIVSYLLTFTTDGVARWTLLAVMPYLTATSDTECVDGISEVLSLAVIEAEASVLAYASEFFWATSNARAFSNAVSIVSVTSYNRRWRIVVDKIPFMNASRRKPSRCCSLVTA